MPPARDPPPLDVREACVQAAHAVIAEQGLEALSLREVARRIGVSHQAPYKHYPSRDHLLAEVMRRCFERFAQRLDARPAADDPMQDMAGLGQAYLSHALEHPLEYRLMFGTPWPEAADEAGLLRDARLAFDVLRHVLERLHGTRAAQDDRIDLDALYIWSSMHGLATVLQSNVLGKLALKKRVLDGAVAHVMHKVEAAMLADAPGPASPPPARARKPSRR